MRILRAALCIFAVSWLPLLPQNPEVPPSETPAPPQEAQPSESAVPPEGEAVKEPEFEGEFHFLDPSTGTLQLLERAILEWKAKSRALGYGGYKMYSQVAGATSPVRLGAEGLEFVVRPLPTMMNINPRDFIYLYPFETKAKTREIFQSSAGFLFLGGNSRAAEEGAIPFETVKHGEHSLRIKPSQKLEPGEYVLILSHAGAYGGTAGAPGGRGYCFGIGPAAAGKKKGR